MIKKIDPVTAKTIVLKVLLQQRHLQTHSAFRREYDRVAADIDPTLTGGWLSKAHILLQFCISARWSEATYLTHT